MSATARSFRQRFDGASRLFWDMSYGCAIAYVVTLGVPAVPGRVVFKGLTVALLALIAFRELAGRDRLLLVAALSLSALGDVFLGLGGEQWFTYGLGSFLIAHLFYITLFVRNRPRPFAASVTRQFIAAAMAVFAAAMFLWLWPSLGEMKLAVALYMLALTGMGVTATLSGFRAGWVTAGAALFILSDALIAVGKFKSPVPASEYLIWATYYVAQAYIALGCIDERRRARL